MDVRRLTRRASSLMLRVQLYIDTRLAPWVNMLARVLSPVLVVLCIALVVGLTYVGVTVVLPLKRLSSTAAYACIAFALFLIFNVLSRYMLCVLTDPGTLPHSTAYKRLVAEKKAAATMDIFDSSVDLEAITTLNEFSPPLNEWNKCKRTGQLRPPRCKFCSVLGMNVLNFDHYCPWVYNAVGYQNIRHFTLFVSYTWLACVYGFILGLDVFYDTFGNHEVPRMYIVLFTVLTATLGLFMSYFAGYYLYLAATNQTAIDNLIFGEQREKDPTFFNPYSKDSVKANLKATLTSRQGGWWELVLPPWPAWQPAAPPY